MIAQVTAASLAGQREQVALAHPASVDTVPTSANQEDHVSMGVTAARKARAICDNTEHVLAVELLCAAQAREFLEPDLSCGRGAEAVHACLRTVVPALSDDRYLADDVGAARELIRSGSLVREVERALDRPLSA